jgi:hypothetical protein
MDVLHQLKRSSPDGIWWIKEDGCDLKECLQESKRKEWHGDIDIGDRTLKELKMEYMTRVRCAEKLTTSLATVDSIQEGLKTDCTFLKTCLSKSSIKYKKAIDAKNTSEEKLMRLNWDVVELSTLLSQCASFQGELEALMDAE